MKSYSQIGTDTGRLVEQKQEQYGDSFGNTGNIMRILYPSGINHDQMDDALAVVRILDKLFRIANGSKGDENPYRDICGYAILGAAKDESK